MIQSYHAQLGCYATTTQFLRELRPGHAAARELREYH
jgi:hypothetical protein